jgi:hypothetical protein
VEMLSARAGKIEARRAVLEETGTGSRHLVPRRARPGSAARCARTTAPFGASSSRVRPVIAAPAGTRRSSGLAADLSQVRAFPAGTLTGFPKRRRPPTPQEPSSTGSAGQSLPRVAVARPRDSTSRKKEISDVA